MTFLRRLLLVSMLCGSAFTASAQSLESLFEQAQQAGVRGETTEALQLYNRLETAGVVDPDVAYNRGLLHAHRGEHGRAILYFERSLRLEPANPDATRALSVVRRSMAQARAQQEGEASLAENPELLAPLVRQIPEPILALSVLLFELLLFGAWFLRRRQKDPHRGRLFAGLGAVGAIAFLLSGAALLLHRGAFDEGEQAIVIEDQVPLREGPDPRAQERHRAREGAYGTILGTEGNHLRLRLGTGEEGWVDRQQIGRI